MEYLAINFTISGSHWDANGRPLPVSIACELRNLEVGEQTIVTEVMVLKFCRVETVLKNHLTTKSGHVAETKVWDSEARTPEPASVASGNQARLENAYIILHDIIQLNF
jgi:hypothetical protein